jgi:hypothetical protein
LRVCTGTAGDARDKCVALVEAAELVARLVRDAGILGPRNDRREHAVDVQKHRGPSRILG